ncbi:ferrichrome transport system substrate-binding protein [Halorubrum sp. DM2]|uniref:ABC transporter substrate-binding protein n=1 Tax=Halorubrum sp. DM2 TaxID=2527867 RepID=UPI0024B85C67|nr:ABC transporter substrate-binding protein [Halorubrum sp. DM2]VTT86256.1 ferrichrome transport system substrate-binding protein [Halorubrum sp. DM2]
MSDNDNAIRHEVSTRREYIKYSGAVVGSGLLAGCTGNSTDSDNADTDTTTSTETTNSSMDSDEETDTAEDAAYSVSMSPAGMVEFELPPETVFTRLTHHAGMAFALGRGDGVNAMHAPDYYDALWNQFVERLPGVSLDWSGLYSSWDPDKEVLYELDSDLHLADPASVAALDSWDDDDVDEITEAVGPWFGNSFSDRHQEPPEGWADDYEYYTLWEQFEHVSRAFQEESRYRELASIRESLLDTIEAEVPSASDRPTVALAGMSDIESIYVYTANAPGFLTAHLRPFDPVDAFDGAVASGEQVDMEAMLEADPDVIFSLGGMAPSTDMVAIRESLRDHPIGGSLTAVQTDRVYAQGARYQGPILNLFQLEMTAKQLYPERFGEWPTYEEGPYPDIPDGEQLFDRERLADIINGDF